MLHRTRHYRTVSVDRTEVNGVNGVGDTTGVSSATSGGAGTTRAKRIRAASLLAATVLTITPGIAAAETKVTGTEGLGRAGAEHACEQGEFCLWTEQDYGGTIVRLDLRNTNPEKCRPLPDGVEAHAFGNRIDRHVTVYQDRNCSTEGDFSTFPGPGTFVPQSPYLVRAVKIWN